MKRFILLGLVFMGLALAQPTLIQPRQIARGTAPDGQAIISNGSNVVWGNPEPRAHNQTASTISDSTTAGRNMLTATNTAAQTALLDVFTSSFKGLAPASGGGTTNFLRADGTWAAPAGGGGGDSISVNGAAATDLNIINGTTSAGFLPVSWTLNTTPTPNEATASINNADTFDARRRKPFMDAEFLSTNANSQSAFVGAVISAGTNTTAPAAGTISSNHAGIVLLRSSTTANSGYQYSTSLTSLRLNGGQQFDLIFWIPASVTNTSQRYGFQDSITTTAPVDGVYVNFPASSLAPTCIARNNNTETASAAIATLTVLTWYHLRVLVTSGSSATCTIWNDAGTQVGTQTVTTNIPTASGRELGIAVLATNSGTVASDLVALDYLSVGWNNALTRGK